MRFAVHRPGYPVASPRSHGVPRRDVSGRVHISVAGETAGSAPEHGLALTRSPVHLPARRAPLARERGVDLLNPVRGLVLQQAHQQPPPRPPVFPGSARPLARTFRPGSSRVPLANRVMFLIFRSSTLITSNRRAMPVLVFSAQSLRRSVSRVRSRAIACLTRPRRFESRFARASVRCSRPSLVRSPRSGRGRQQLVRWTAPRRPLPPGRCPPPGRYPVREPARGSPRRRHASGPRGPSSPDRTFHRGGHGAGPAEPHPPGLGHPDLADVAGTPGAPPTAVRAPRRSGTPRAARALRHDGCPAGLPGSKNAAIAWAKSRSACCCTVWEAAASHGYSARAWVSCRHCSR